jgi:hypothetical protein
MDYEITYSCAQVHSVYEGEAGSSIACNCGRTIQVPSLRELRGQAISVAPTPGLAELRLTRERPPPPARPTAEILAPTQVSPRTKRGAASVMAALSANALWIQDVWQLRQIPLQTISAIEARQYGQELVLNLGSEPPVETLRLTFASAAEGERGHKELQARQQQPSFDTPSGDLHRQ